MDVRSEHFDTMVVETIHHLGMGVPEAVSRSKGKDGQVGPGLRQQRGTGRCPAPVMPRPQYLDRSETGGDPVFDVRRRIAHDEGREGSVADRQDDRNVVRVIRGAGPQVLSARVEHLEGHSIELELDPVRGWPPGCSPGPSRFDHIQIRPARRRPGRVQKSADLQGLQDRAASAEMIEVRMREHDRIELANPAPQEKRNHSPLSGVEVRRHGSDVDSDPPSTGSANSGGVTLPHIQEVDLHGAPIPLADEGPEEEDQYPARGAYAEAHRPAQSTVDLREPLESHGGSERTESRSRNPPTWNPGSCPGNLRDAPHHPLRASENDLDPSREEPPCRWERNRDEERNEDSRDGHGNERRDEHGHRNADDRDSIEVPCDQRERGERSRGSGGHAIRHNTGKPTPAPCPQAGQEGALKEDEPSRAGKRELKPGRGHGSRVEEKDTDQSRCQGSRRVNGSSPQPSEGEEEKDGSRPGRCVWHADSGHVECRDHRGHENGPFSLPAESPKQPQDESSDHSHVEAGDREQMGGTGLRERLSQLRIQPLAACEHQRVHHPRSTGEEVRDPVLDGPTQPNDGRNLPTGRGHDLEATGGQIACELGSTRAPIPTRPPRPVDDHHIPRSKVRPALRRKHPNHTFASTRHPAEHLHRERPLRAVITREENPPDLHVGVMRQMIPTVAGSTIEPESREERPCRSGDQKGGTERWAME